MIDDLMKVNSIFSWMAVISVIIAYLSDYIPCMRHLTLHHCVKFQDLRLHKDLVFLLLFF